MIVQLRRRLRCDASVDCWRTDETDRFLPGVRIELNRWRLAFEQRASEKRPSPDQRATEKKLVPAPDVAHVHAHVIVPVRTDAVTWVADRENPMASVDWFWEKPLLPDCDHPSCLEDG